jgi:KGK domain
MENQFKTLDYQSEYKDSVISFSGGHTFKICNFVEVANEFFREKGLVVLKETLNSKGIGNLPNYSASGLNIHGVAGELLMPKAQGWKKGKIRIRVVLEFCPDEPDEKDSIEEIKKNGSESPLDDIRKSIN